MSSSALVILFFDAFCGLILRLNPVIPLLTGIPLCVFVLMLEH